MSGMDKKAKIPQPPAPAVGTGNLLSSVAPPSQLPNFVTASPVAPAVTPTVEVGQQQDRRFIYNTYVINNYKMFHM